MARNEDSDPDDDDQYSPQTVAPQMPPPHQAQLIALDQHSSSDDGGPTRIRYISHCFI
jgi:hypothetical protein